MSLKSAIDTINEMKTLYSSTFMSAVLGFLLLLGQTEQNVILSEQDNKVNFRTIINHPEQTVEEEKVVIEVFTSFGCPECDTFGRGTLFELKEKYANSTEEENTEVELKIFFTPDKNNPSELYGVKGAHCAAEHERFWDMVRNLYLAPVINQREVDLIGQGMGLPIVEFRDCLRGETIMEKIDANIDYKRERQIEKRPSISVGKKLLLGNQPIENIEREVQRSLKE